MGVSSCNTCGHLLLQPVGSLVMLHRLGCPMAYGIPVLNQGLKSESPRLKDGFFNTSPQENPVFKNLNEHFYLPEAIVSFPPTYEVFHLNINKCFFINILINISLITLSSLN